MRRACALLMLVAVMLVGCGMMGEITAAADAEAAETDDEELERSQ